MKNLHNMLNYFPFVPISNDFIEGTMLKANPSFVVVYLYILKKAISGEELVLESLSNKLNIMQSDIIKSLDYFKNEKIINYDLKSGLIYIEFIEKQTSIQTTKDKSTNIGDYTEQEFLMICQKEEMQELFRFTEKKLSKTLSSENRRTLTKLYENYGLSMEVLAMLFTYCITKQKCNFNYIEKVAIDWIENDIDTTEKAEAYLELTNKSYKKVMRAFGIRNREPIKKEADFIKKWIIDYKMPIDIIEEACNRTIIKTSQANFEYANAIIGNWYQNNIKNLEQLQSLDDNFEVEKKAKSEKFKKQSENMNNTKYPPQNKNKFTNYSQREPDYDLLRKIEMMDLKKG